MNEEMRAEFEKWALDRGLDLYQMGAMDYFDDETQASWKGWQAAWSASRKSVLESMPQDAKDAIESAEQGLATVDQCIELAEQLVWETVRQTVSDVKAIAAKMTEGPLTYGMQTACEEIETRLGLLPAEKESDNG